MSCTSEEEATFIAIHMDIWKPIAVVGESLPPGCIILASAKGDKTVIKMNNVDNVNDLNGIYGEAFRDKCDRCPYSIPGENRCIYIGNEKSKCIHDTLNVLHSMKDIINKDRTLFYATEDEIDWLRDER